MGNSLSVRQFGLNELTRLARGLGFTRALAATDELFTRLTPGWDAWSLGDAPPWQSRVTGDGTPLELSVAFTGRGPVVRVLVESRRAPFGLTENWHSGLDLTRSLGELPGVGVERFERVAPLFAPRAGSRAGFGLFHAGSVSQDGRLSFEVLLNPLSAGPAAARDLVRDALALLGAEYAWDELAPKLTRRSELVALGLELSDREDARVRVHVAHPRASASEIDALVWDSAGYFPGLARRWIETLAGARGRFEAEPIVTCHAFRSPLHAAEVTVAVPSHSYLAHDAESLARASELIGLDALALRAGVEAMAGRPLDTGRGLVRSVSVRPAAYGTRVSVHLAPEAPACAAPRRAHVAEVFQRKHGLVTSNA